MEKQLSLLLQLESIKGNGSQTIKQEILKNNRSAELDYILDVCYNPFVTTKLNKVSYNTSDPREINPNLYQEFHSLIEELKKSPSANTQLRNRASDLISNSGLNDQLKEMLGRVLTKNMNIGLGAKLINKATGTNLIPDPSLMLAKDEIGRIDKWKKIICEFKYDGVRVIAKIGDNNEVEFFTRSFNQLDSKYLTKIIDEILILANGRTGIFFDGELTDFDRKSVSGKVTSILSGKAPEKIGNTFLFNIFDIEDNNTLITEKGKVPYPTRRALLESCFEGKEFNHLLMATKWELTSKEDIWEIYKHIVEVERGEGVILKDIDHVYECRRSNSWIKLKEIKDCDLIITGINEPHPMSVREKNSWIGGFICQSSDRKLIVSVGSGFSEALLEEIKRNGPESYIGKIVKVKYNMIIQDKLMGYSLFLPTLLEIRSDKSEADTLERIQLQEGKA